LVAWVLLLKCGTLLKVFLRGKSELHRAGCRVIPGGVRPKLNPSESATENIPPARLSSGFVIRCF